MKLSLLMLIIGSVYIQIIRKDYTVKFRDKIAFIGSGYLPVSLALMNFNKILPILATLNSLIVFLNCFTIVFLLSLFKAKIRRSLPHKLIIYFWMYLMLTSFWSEAWLPIFSEKLATFLVFLSGVALGHHILSCDKMDKVFQIMVFAGVFLLIVVYFIVLPKLAGHFYVEKLTGAVRIGGKGLVNPNTVAMVLVPFALTGIIRSCNFLGDKKAKSDLWTILIGGGLCVFAAWLIIRSGSRTGFLSLCISAIVAFSFSAQTRFSRWALLLFFITVSAWFLLNSSNSKYRVLNIKGDSDEINLSGRTSEWEEGLNKMTELEVFIGTGGTPNYSTNEVTWARYLSIYVTIFNDCGIIGCVLLFLFALSVAVQVLRLGKDAMPAASFIAAALLYGFGESGPISPFNIQCLFFGFGVGLLPTDIRSGPSWLIRRRRYKVNNLAIHRF